MPVARPQSSDSVELPFLSSAPFKTFTTIHVPPLRSRGGDVPLLCQFVAATGTLLGSPGAEAEDGTEVAGLLAGVFDTGLLAGVFPFGVFAVGTGGIAGTVPFSMLADGCVLELVGEFTASGAPATSGGTVSPAGGPAELGASLSQNGPDNIYYLDQSNLLNRLPDDDRSAVGRSASRTPA